MREVSLSHMPEAVQKPVILFAGPQSCFSDLYLKLVRAEFQNNDVWFEADFTAAQDILDDSAVDVVVLVTTCCNSVATEPLLDLLQGIPGNTSVAIAYEDPADIGRLQGQPGNSRFSAFSFLPMNRKVDVAMSSLALIVAGEHHIPCDVMQLMNAAPPAEISSADKPCIDKLTPREEEVLTLVADGMPNKLIADRLTLSESTVKLHIHHVISKLGVHNRTEAALIFHEVQRGPGA